MCGTRVFFIPSMPQTKKILRFWQTSIATAALIALSSCSSMRSGIAPEELLLPRQHGIVSYYGSEFEGRKTASGEKYSSAELTAAHPALPFGTRVLVTELLNGRSVTVRINDRGPFVKGRIIDLSYLAATKLGIIERGTADVVLQVLKGSSLPTNDDTESAP